MYVTSSDQMVNLYNQTLLSLYNTKIEKTFNEYKVKTNFMAIYFSNKDKMFITFKNNPELFVKTYNKFNLGFIFDCSISFEEQLNHFLI